eukprot:TRINITY_DN81863_c0_g1_i1.p1 TRINITY_DN81863_c0_g1~~TRINITY_DN81863_c0_g1_i1.p1  ORF type:complete len:298 (+),score=47.24 TRINITY_DN81863_c0_g1_i1:98-895(+)
MALGDDPGYQNLAAEALGALGQAMDLGPRAAALAEALGSAGASAEQRRAANFLGELSKSVSARELECLALATGPTEQRPPEVRRAAAMAFGTLSLGDEAQSKSRQAAIACTETLCDAIKKSSTESGKDLSVIRTTVRALGLLGESATHHADNMFDMCRNKQLREETRMLQLEHRCSTAAGQRAADVMMMRYRNHQEQHQQLWRNRGAEARQVRGSPLDALGRGNFQVSRTTSENFRMSSSVFRLTGRTCLARTGSDGAQLHKAHL